MFNIPDDIVKFFFEEIHIKGKYEIIIDENKAFIKPRKEEAYYKPVIQIKNIEEFRIALYEYVKCLEEFYSKYKTHKPYHDLSYFFNLLLFNMTFCDSEDLTSFVYKRCSFYKNEQFNQYTERTLICEIDEVKYYVTRVAEEPGLETPFILIFDMEKDGIIYPLPLVRYAIDSDNICHLFTIQFGKGREYDTTIHEYKSIVNRINSGTNKFRNVSPSFVLCYTLFLKLLQDEGIKEIIVPGFLFSRYKHYYKATTVKQSNILLNRLLNNFVRLMQRMEYEIDGFDIWCYLEEFDSNTHIKLGEMKSSNGLIGRILEKKNKN